MNFFKNLFGKKSNNTEEEKTTPEKVTPENATSEKAEPENQENSNKKYLEQSLESIESLSKKGTEHLEAFFKSKNIEFIDNPISHPINLDIALSFETELPVFFQSRGFENNMMIVTLAYTWSEFIVKNFNFKLYIDTSSSDAYTALVLKHQENKEVSMLPVVNIVNTLYKQSRMNDMYNDMRKDFPNDITNNYTIESNIEQYIEEELQKTRKKGILIEVKSKLAGDRDANIQNAFIFSKITNEKLQNEILKYYDWYSLPDIDIDFNCTMQLINRNVYEKMDKSITGEKLMEYILSQFND